MEKHSESTEPKAAKRPECFYFFFFLSRQASSIIAWTSHTGLHTK